MTVIESFGPVAKAVFGTKFAQTEKDKKHCFEIYILRRKLNDLISLLDAETDFCPSFGE